MVVEERAPAKLNLRLRFTGRRSDGYHLLSMLNVQTSLCDVVRVAPAEERTFALAGPLAQHVALADSSNNLVLRAVELFCSRLSIPPKFALVLEKRVPIGSGLGGGSSDAAATLRALARFSSPQLVRLGVPPEALKQELRACAVRLGADVPFFLEFRAAVVSGIGDRVVPLDHDPFSGMEARIVVPPVAVETSAAYALVRASLPQLSTCEDDELLARLPELRAGDRRALPRLVANDFEPIVSRAYPPVGALLAALRTLPGSIAGMTGSGSALFVLPAEGSGLDAAIDHQLRRIAQRHSAEVLPVVLGTDEKRFTA